MNQKIPEKQQRLHCKAPIIILSFISLVFYIISSVKYFVYYETKYLYNYEYFLTTPSAPSEIAQGLLRFVLCVAPAVLFIIYILKFFKDSKATIIVPMVFGYFVFPGLFSIITNITEMNKITIIALAGTLFDIVVFALATYGSLKGFSKKIFVIPILIFVVFDVFGTISLNITMFDYWIENELYLYILTYNGGAIASVTFCIALFLFAIKNKIPTIISGASEKATETINPEQELRLLQERFNNGMLSEEEYKLKRAEVINKL